jgi:hypothetical protein
MSGRMAVLGTYAGSAAFRPDAVFAPPAACGLPLQADSNGATAAAPAIEAAAVMNLLRFNSIPMEPGPSPLKCRSA